MGHRDDEIKHPTTLRRQLLAGLVRSARQRPVSFYLLFAMIAVLLLGGQVVYIKDDPRQFALFLSLYFVFFFVLIFRAILDFFDIARAHFRQSEVLLTETFAEDGFAARLGQGVAAHERKQV